MKEKRRIPRDIRIDYVVEALENFSKDVEFNGRTVYDIIKDKHPEYKGIILTKRNMCTGVTLGLVDSYTSKMRLTHLGIKRIPTEKSSLRPIHVFIKPGRELCIKLWGRGEPL